MIQPTQTKERIQSLDILRGFAILGILIMNIQSFSMPGGSYLNPAAYGDLTGINKWVWILSHIFGDMKFMTIFSILYGAGIVLVTSNAEKKTGKSAGLHYRRTFWLLIIGLIHAHLIWYGDILVPYALCALFVFLFRKMKPGKLIVIGTILILVHTVIYLFFGMTMPYWPPESVAEMSKSWAPPESAIIAEIEAYTGTWMEQFSERSENALFLETGVFLMLFVWRAGGLMLVGMALYKWGVLTAERTARYYLRGFIIGWIIGLPIVIYGVYRNFEGGWAVDSMFIGSQYNYIGSLFVSFGFICLMMLMAKSSAFIWIKGRLAAIGQTALSNYLLQSILATTLFYGFGFGLFGQVDRWGQVLIMIGIWIIQLLITKPWIERYYFGPAEWAWRSLTYMKRQPFKRG